MQLRKAFYNEGKKKKAPKKKEGFINKIANWISKEDKNNLSCHSSGSSDEAEQ